MEYEEILKEPEEFYSSRDFTDLDCWKKARQLRIEISNLVKSFPDHEKYRLTDQLVRSSRSVTDSIAEGYGRFYYRDNIRFCYIGRGSILEVKNHLITALDEEYIAETKLSELEELREACHQLLNGYIRYLIQKAREHEKNS